MIATLRRTIGPWSCVDMTTVTAGDVAAAGSVPVGRASRGRSITTSSRHAAAASIAARR